MAELNVKMRKLRNDHRISASDALAAFCQLYPSHVRLVRGGVVASAPATGSRVHLVTGGGAGHYPGVSGFVGPGLASGAAIGEVFAAPSSARILNICEQLEARAGIIFCYGNYAGDNLNFKKAAEQLSANGIHVEQIVVADDITSAPPGEAHARRGIAGEILVLKVLGAACDAGLPIEEAARLGSVANTRIRSIGVAFRGGSIPGGPPNPSVIREGFIGWGLGVHGEAHLDTVPFEGMESLSRRIVSNLLSEAPEGKRISVLVNGLGATKMEELLLVWRSVSDELLRLGHTIIAPLIGEFITSFNCEGFSVSILWLTDEIEPYLLAPCDTPGLAVRPLAVPIISEQRPEAPASLHSRRSSFHIASQAKILVRSLRAINCSMRTEERRLATLDAISGDGDHGHAMRQGSEAAVKALIKAVRAGHTASDGLIDAADAWTDAAGGTSGFLWGVGIEAFAQSISAANQLDLPAQVDAFESALRTIKKCGGAREGDRTMVDAMGPFVETLSSEARSGKSAPEAWGAAIRAGDDGYLQTASMLPLKGRSKPHGSRVLGHGDPGAASFMSAMRALFKVHFLKACRTRADT